MKTIFHLGSRSPRTFLLFILLFLPACGQVASPPNRNSKAPTNGLVQVIAQKPKRQSVRNTTTQPATVHPYHRAEIYARVAGYLKELRADIGKVVKKGEVLGIIDIPELEKRKQKQLALIRKLEAVEAQAKADIKVAEANIKSAQANLSSAQAKIDATDAQLSADKKEYERIRDLVQSQSVATRLQDEAKKRFDSAKAAKVGAEAHLDSVKETITVAKARLEVAKANQKAAAAETDVARKDLQEMEAMMEFAKLKAPFAGTVVERHVEPGDLVRNTETTAGRQSPLFVVSELKRLRVRVPVPERDAALVQVGAKAAVKLNALGGRPIQAKVSRVAGMLEDDTRTMLVEVDLKNNGYSVLPGMFGQATIVLEKRPNCLVLPAQMVRYDKTGNSYVMVVDSKDKIQTLAVQTGLDDGEIIEITSGLQGDERIVLPTVRRLKSGQKVQVVQ